MQYFFDMDKSRLAHLVSSIFTLCIVGGYIIYCVEADGDIFLPTISTTWDFRPGNFLSRWCIGTGCVAFYILLIMTWKGYKLNYLLYLTSVAAVFCLSVVGAVCSSNKSIECYGNRDIHLTAAISCFVFFDVYMAIILITGIGAERKKLVSVLTMRISFVASFLSKVRMISRFSTHHSFPVFAVFEYLNVAAIIAFCITFACSIPENLKFSLVRLSAKSEIKNSGFVWEMSGTNTLQIALRYATGTLLSCLVTALLFQTVDPDQFPMISDTFVYPPGNYISRWAGIIGCTYLQLANICLDHCYREHMGKRFGRLCSTIAFVSSFGLSIVVVVSENEDQYLHFPAAITFFGGYLILIGLVPLGLILKQASQTEEKLNEPLIQDENVNKSNLITETSADNPKLGIKLFLACFFLSLLTKLRYSSVMMSYCHFPTIQNDVRSVIAVIEWIDAMAILSFLFSMFLVFPRSLNRSKYIIRNAEIMPSVKTNSASILRL
mmetsp:Transcript_1655/g.2009  ORF Transcript_1655/g.2009 Transcript_1655/m.2009 type:complete len:493 (+) Transcript_1655:197-1675(+)